MLPPSNDLAARCGPIELLVVDVDGVMTDGVIAIDDHGVETKHFFVRDGSGINLWRRAGKRAAILSGRRATVVDRRAAELGMSPVVQGKPEKLEPFRAMVSELGMTAQQVCYVGDDLPDLPVFSLAGLAACPSDAAPEVLRRAHLVAQMPGGRGAVRDVIETILKHQGVWDSLLARYQVDDG